MEITVTVKGLLWKVEVIVDHTLVYLFMTDSVFFLCLFSLFVCFCFFFREEAINSVQIPLGHTLFFCVKSCSLLNAADVFGGKRGSQDRNADQFFSAVFCRLSISRTWWPTKRKRWGKSREVTSRRYPRWAEDITRMHHGRGQRDEYCISPVPLPSPLPWRAELRRLHRLLIATLLSPAPPPLGQEEASANQCRPEIP